MAFWNRPSQLVERTEAVTQQLRELDPAGPIALALASSTPSAWGGASLALCVPAIARGVKLISGTVAQLPLTQWRDGAVVPNQLLAQPEPDHTYWRTMQATVQDLVLHGVAYWMVLDTQGGFPTKVRQLPADEVTQDAMDTDAVRYKGQRLLKSHPAGPGTQLDSVITFQSFAGGILANGWETIATALDLEAAVRRYAQVPLPSFALRNTGADLPPDQIQQLLEAWELSRQERSTAYLSSAVEAEAFGWSSADLQMTEARNEAAIQCARLLNLDPHWVAASVQGTSLTYSNRIDLRNDLISLTLTDYLAPVGQRLSMRDVTPTHSSNRVAFDTTEFLRGSLTDRAALVASLLPTEVITVDEARTFLTFAPGERTPLA